MTIRARIDEAVARFPRRTAMVYSRDGAWVRVTYAALGERIRRAAEGFARLGVEPRRDCVALMLENGPEWVEIYSALAGTGVTVVPMDPGLRGPEIAHMLDDSQAAAVIAQASHAATLAEVLPDIPSVRSVVLVGGPPAPAAIAARRTESYEALLTASPVPDCGSRYDTSRPSESDIASIIYTSGTTGKPKGAMLTHINFCSDAAGALDVLADITPRDRFLVVLPLFHSFAFMGNYVVPLSRGCALCFVQSLRTIGEDCQTLAPTVLMAVPLLVEKLFKKIDERLKASAVARFLLAIGLGRWVGIGVRRRLGGSLRLLVVGGAPCPVPVITGFRALGFGMIEGYGLTEAAPVVSLSRVNDARPGMIGYALPNISVRIAGADAQGVGEIQVRGPIVMRGYFRNPGATAEAFDGEWLRTGDLAVMDADGYLTIRGRMKALIVNREGKNIYPEEVEQVIALDPRVRDIVVIGYREGHDVGEKVGAIAVPNLDAIAAENGGHAPGWGEIESLMRRIVAEQCRLLSDYKHPRKLVVRREPLERTSTQKVRRHVYQDQLDTPGESE